MYYGFIKDYDTKVHTQRPHVYIIMMYVCVPEMACSIDVKSFQYNGETCHHWLYHTEL